MGGLPVEQAAHAEMAKFMAEGAWQHGAGKGQEQPLQTPEQQQEADQNGKVDQLSSHPGIFAGHHGDVEGPWRRIYTPFAAARRMNR